MPELGKSDSLMTWQPDTRSLKMIYIVCGGIYIITSDFRCSKVLLVQKVSKVHFLRELRIPTSSEIGMTSFSFSWKLKIYDTLNTSRLAYFIKPLSEHRVFLRPRVSSFAVRMLRKLEPQPNLFK